MKKCISCKVVSVLAGLGALNWLLVALFNVNIVAMIFGDMTTLSKIIYTLIGISGAMLITSLFVNCPGCKK